jgi:hypothetical protein
LLGLIVVPAAVLRYPPMILQGIWLWGLLLARLILVLSATPLLPTESPFRLSAALAFIGLLIAGAALFGMWLRWVRRRQPLPIDVPPPVWRVLLSFSLVLSLPWTAGEYRTAAGSIDGVLMIIGIGGPIWLALRIARIRA